MKVKTSVSLTDEVVAEIDRLCGPAGRSRFIEDAVKHELLKLSRLERDRQDIAIINANLDRLNAEAMEVLEYQAGWCDLSGAHEEG